jgi:hypothetical protein
MEGCEKARCEAEFRIGGSWEASMGWANYVSPGVDDEKGGTDPIGASMRRGREPAAFRSGGTWRRDWAFEWRAAVRMKRRR